MESKAIMFETSQVLMLSTMIRLLSFAKSLASDQSEVAPAAGRMQLLPLNDIIAE